MEIVKKLKKDKYKLAILSNTICSHARINRKKGLYDLFPIVILSNEVGLRKPDPKIFKLVLDQLGTKPEESVFIDNKKEHTNAASKLGLKVIVFKNVNQLKRDLKKLKILS